MSVDVSGEFDGQLAILDSDCRLRVQVLGTWIKIERPDYRPPAIDRRRFGVQSVWPLEFPEVYPARSNVPLAASKPAWARRPSLDAMEFVMISIVVTPRARGRVDLAEKLRGRNEIGCFYQNRMVAQSHDVSQALRDSRLEVLLSHRVMQKAHGADVGRPRPQS